MSSVNGGVLGQPDDDRHEQLLDAGAKIFQVQGAGGVPEHHLIWFPPVSTRNFPMSGTTWVMRAPTCSKRSVWSVSR